MIEDILIPFCTLTGDLKWRKYGKEGQSETVEVTEDTSPSRRRYNKLDRPAERPLSRWDMDKLLKEGVDIESYQKKRKRELEKAQKRYEKAEKIKVREVTWVKNRAFLVSLKPHRTVRRRGQDIIFFRDFLSNEAEYPVLASDLPSFWERSTFGDGKMMAKAAFKRVDGRYFLDILDTDLENGV